MPPRDSRPPRRRRLALVATLATLTLLCAQGDRAVEADGEKAGDKKRPPTQIYALLIGCTEYPEFKKVVSAAKYEGSIRLLGCLNDVNLMRKTLIERMGASAGNIRALAGWPADKQARPTTANVRGALEALAKRTYAKGDRVIVHYSGHGVQVPDDNGDEADGLDEAWLLADGRKDRATTFAGTLLDDEIGALLRAIRARGATVWCLMDCCHSATGMRGTADPEVRTRGFDPALVDIEVSPSPTRGMADTHEVTPMGGGGWAGDGIAVFYAAQSFQEVPEVRLPPTGSDRTSYGLLTSTTARAIRRSGDRLTFSELYEHIVAGYRDLGQHHVVQPLAEGDLAQSVFGGMQPLGMPLVLRRVGRRELELSAGALHGLAEGTELDVYAPGAAGKAGDKLGRVVVHQLGAEVARVHPLKGTSDDWAKGSTGPWPTQIAKFVVGDGSLPLAIVDEGDRPIAFEVLEQGARAVLDAKLIRSRFPRVRNAAAAKWVLVASRDGRLVALRASVRGHTAPRFQVTAKTLESTLLTIYRGENLLKLAGRAAGMGRLPGNLELRIRRRQADGSLTPVRAGQRIPPGAILDMGLIKRDAESKTDARTVDVFVFWVDPHYGVAMLYPTQQGGPRLAEDDVTTGDEMIRVGFEGGEQTSDVSQGLERIVVFALPKRDDAPHLRLAFLAQPPLQLLRARGVGTQEQDGVAGLLRDLALGTGTTRGRVQRVDTGANKLHMKVFSFETRWGAIRIPSLSGGRKALRIQQKTPARAAGSPPDPWRLGQDVHVAPAGPTGAACLLVGQNAGAAHVLIDIDGQVSPVQQTGDGLQKLVQERSFDAEMAIRVERNPKRVVVWYDVDNDGRFDHVLIDANGDHRAEERFRRGPAGWTHDRGIDISLLSTGHLAFIGDDVQLRTKAVERLFTIAGE